MPKLFELSALMSAPDGEDAAAASAVRDVVREHAGYVGRCLRYLGVPEADLEDATQEVFVVVHRKLAGFEGRSSLTSWLYGIALKVAAAHRRKASTRHEVLVDETPEVSVVPEQERQVAAREAREMLLRALDRLDDDKRAVFVLYELEQRPMQEIAEQMGCPLQTAYYRLHTAREIVTKALQAMASDKGRGR